MRQIPKPGQTFSSIHDVDPLTRRWIRNKSDEYAALNGCWFDRSRARHVVRWLKDNLRLYEGEKAGCPFICGDWQTDCFSRMFGWVRYDEEWTEIKRREGVIGPKEWAVVRRFNQAFILIAKKNGKSPSLAALSLYLLAGDGEQGAKCYIFAKDGTQVKQIVGEHILRMVESSETLSAECVLNKTTMVLRHEPTNSLLIPASSSDARTQQAKEGINGNIFVDEVHVVDRRLMDRVSRAGISRMEPFQIEVTTAGNDPDGYGKERRDYVRAVIDGVVQDQRLFGALYEAPQDLTFEQLDADPLKYFKMANPAAGRLVRESEFLQDYETSKSKGPIELKNLMMYRLNVWLNAADNMIEADKWESAVDADLKIEDLYGGRGGIGIDLAKSNDMCSVVFTVKKGETYLQFPFVFMTDVYAERNRHLVKGFVEWGLSGDLILITGAKIRDEDIFSAIEPHLKKIRPTMIVYDETFATDLAFDIQETLGGEKGCELVGMAQTYARYSEPTQQWIEDLNSGLIRYAKNAVLDWQARIVQLGRRQNFIKPIKQETKSHHKIDGIQASIMSHLACRRAPNKVSVYASRGVVLV